MDDGVTLRCDIYRPPEDGEYPVIITYGPYGKWLHFEQLYDHQWETMTEENPEIAAGTSGEYMTWETVDPEKWVPDGYAVVRVDSRGAGRSEGYLDVWSRQETEDFAECIEWAGTRDWSNGRVGINGISYYAQNGWQVAALQPDHLEALCAWEGASDWYREAAYNGGIYNTWTQGWHAAQVESLQHGLGENGFRSAITGEWVSGPETLSEEELGANRADIREDYLSNDLATDDYWQERNPDWSAVEVPVLSAANWGGQGLHPRGNYEGFRRAASEDKWLEVHGDAHWTHFYTDYGLELQKRFFDHFLKGEDPGWDDQPAVQLQVRHPGEEFEERHEDDWPIPRTDWTRHYLDAGDASLSTAEPDDSAETTYDPFGDGVTFLTDPIEEETELTGPVSARLFVSSATEDADLFLAVRVFTPDMEEVVFQGSNDPHTPVALGWLRASHRKLDGEKSEPWRPYHTHDERQPLEPGEVCELDVEVWPTSIVVPEGYRIGLSVRGNDYEYPGDATGEGGTIEGSFDGVGPFTHDDPRDRPADVYGGNVTVYTGPDHPSSVLFPVVPEE
jgi:predicted acyl esterase